MTALQPRDVTFISKRPTLRVQSAWKRRGEGGTFLGAPKTKKSRRTLVLTREQVRLFQRLCLGKKPTDLVFTAPEGGAWHSGVFYAHRWKPALARPTPPVSPSLRGFTTFATPTLPG
nr:hypothetical protein OH820_09560 [Streptomyces sp. NBC_00857]